MFRVRETVISPFSSMLGAKRRRFEKPWSRQDVVICHCSRLSYRHVHCPCNKCEYAAVSTSVEYSLERDRGLTKLDEVGMTIINKLKLNSMLVDLTQNNFLSDLSEFFWFI